MFRESLPKTRDRFLAALDSSLSGAPREAFSSLVHGAFDMYHGLVDQETLAATDFLTNPWALINVVNEGVAGGDERVRLHRHHRDDEPRRLQVLWSDDRAKRPGGVFAERCQQRRDV